jgi:DNA-binding transcriptional regulator YbjK
MRGGDTETDGRRSRGAARRRQILIAALRVIARDGIGGATHRAIAEEAGVAISVTTYHFNSIDELLRDALRLFVDEEIARVRTATAAIGDAGTPLDLAGLTAAVVEAVGNVLVSPLAQFELYLEASRRPALATEARACLEAYLELGATFLEELGAPHPQQGARALVALLDGLTVQRLVDPSDDFDIAVAVPALLALVGALVPSPTS